MAPEFFGNARVSYNLPGDWPVIAVAVSLVGRRPTDGAFDEGWKPVPVSPTQVEVRPTISGLFPGVPGLSYRLIADYARAAVNPYLVGPVNAPTMAVRTPELIPVDQFRTTIGLQYDLEMTKRLG